MILLRKIGAAELEITMPSVLLRILLLLIVTRDFCPIASPKPVSSKTLFRISPVLLPTAESPFAPFFLKTFSLIIASALPARNTPSRSLFTKVLLLMATRFPFSNHIAVPRSVGFVKVIPSTLTSSFAKIVIFWLVNEGLTNLPLPLMKVFMPLTVGSPRRVTPAGSLIGNDSPVSAL